MPTSEDVLEGRRARRRLRRESNRELLKVQKRAWHAANREKALAGMKEWHAANSERVKARKKAWRLAHPDKAQAQSKAWYDANRDKAAARKRTWQIANPGHVNAVSAARRAGLKKATPPWVDHDAIRRIYAVAAMLGWHVDHIHPLKGKNFCGLHVPWNLQVLAPLDNIRKSNAHPVDVSDRVSVPSHDALC